MKCNKILESLKEEMPLSLAMSWDNAGFLVGRADKDIKKVYVALDPTSAVIDRAIDLGVELIITHHPLIFMGLKSITDGDIVGRRILRLIEGGINHIAMHTNYDIADSCMSDIVAKKLSIEGEPLEVTCTDEISAKHLGIGKVGDLPIAISLGSLVAKVKQDFKLDFVRLYGGNDETPVSRIAISPGSGKGMYRQAAAAGAQVLISGDISHHDGIDALEEGIISLDAGHYGIEQVFIEDMAERLHGISAELTVYTESATVPDRVM